MLRSFIITILLSLCIAIAAPSYAQTLDQTATLTSFLQHTNAELDQARLNLLAMSQGMQSPEFEHTNSIYDTATNVSNYFDRLLVVGGIYSVMIDRRDQATVKKIMALHAKQSVKASDRTIGFINSQLAKLRSPAAIAEAQKARDLVIKIRDEIQRTFPE